MAIEIPNREELNAHFYQFCKDSDYLNSIWAQVRKDYPDHYVAVYGGAVVATHANLKRLVATLREQGIPSNHTAIRFVSKKPRRLIL